MKAGAGLVGEFARAARDVGAGQFDVAGLHGFMVDLCGSTDNLFDGGDHVAQADGFVVTQVPDAIAVGGGAVVGVQDSLHDVVDVGVIAGGGAVAEHGDGMALGDALHEAADGEVGALARAEDGEEAQQRNWLFGEMHVRVREKFARAFAGGVGTDGRADVEVFAEGRDFAIAVDAAG